MKIWDGEFFQNLGVCNVFYMFKGDEYFCTCKVVIVFRPWYSSPWLIVPLTMSPPLNVSLVLSYWTPKEQCLLRWTSGITWYNWAGGHFENGHWHPFRKSNFLTSWARMVCSTIFLIVFDLRNSFLKLFLRLNHTLTFQFKMATNHHLEI